MFAVWNVVRDNTFKMVLFEGHVGCGNQIDCNTLYPDVSS